MSTVANIYDNGPISPVCKERENISVWSENRDKHFNVKYIEPIPRSSPFMVELITASGATVLAANGQIQRQLVNALLMNDGELLHLRWEPLDDVEGMLWELASAARNNPRGGQARVNLFTSARDPYLATSTFYILGQNLDAQFEVRNPNPVAIALARFVFWGYRYIVGKELPNPPQMTTYLPAQAWSS